MRQFAEHPVKYSGYFYNKLILEFSQKTTHTNYIKMEQEVPIYAPFFGVMGAAAAIIFSGKSVYVLCGGVSTE